MIWEHKLNALPIINDEQQLLYFVFRKDYESKKDNPNELLDSSKRLHIEKRGLKQETTLLVYLL